MRHPIRRLDATNARTKEQVDFPILSDTSMIDNGFSQLI
jgi:hypothetical protein